jgi:hypothetical protein
MSWELFKRYMDLISAVVTFPPFPHGLIQAGNLVIPFLMIGLPRCWSRLMTCSQTHLLSAIAYPEPACQLTRTAYAKTSEQEQDSPSQGILLRRRDRILFEPQYAFIELFCEMQRSLRNTQVDML